MNNTKVQTLTDFIRYGKTSSFSIPNVSFLIKSDNIVYLDEVAYAKYNDLLLENSTVLDLTTIEYNKYRLEPKLLSYELYGTPNLYHLILYLNNVSEFEFDLKRVRLLNYSSINDMLKLILAHEEDNINKSIISSKG